MSTKLLWCTIVLGTYAAAAYINRHDGGLISSLQNDSISLNGNGFYIYSPNRRVVVEEVDRNGNSVVKELELPDYDISEELQEDKRRREQQEKEYQNEIKMSKRQMDMYGCDSGKENQRKKCLQRRKKLLRRRYKNWKELIRQVIKDLDGKIKNLKNSRKESTTENLNFMLGFSPENVRRKKE